jgi:hypothetical protein
MTIDLTFTVGNIITLCGVIGFFFWVKFNIDRIIQVIFSPSGTVRLISFDAHDRMQENCRTLHSKDSGYAAAQMLRIEKLLAEQAEAMARMDGKMDSLAGCVAALKYGADGKDLDNC